MPWWGWLIAAVIALGTVYLVFAMWWARKVGSRVLRTFDDVRDAHFTADARNPFDDPFFKDPFGRGQVRKPNDRYL